MHYVIYQSGAPVYIQCVPPAHHSPSVYAAVPLLHSLWNWCTALRSDSWRIFPDHSCIPGIRHGLLYGILTAGIQDISHNHRTHRKHTSTAFYGLRTLVGCVQKSAVVKYLLANMGRFIRSIGHNDLCLRKIFRYLAVNFINGHSVADFACSYHRLNYKAVFCHKQYVLHTQTAACARPLRTGRSPGR